MFSVFCLCLVFGVTAFPLAAASPKPPAWWQFGEYLDKQLGKYQVLTTIPCSYFNLSPRQREMCENPRNRDLMIKLGLAVNLAVQVSNETFANRRWRSHYTGGKDVFGPIVNQDGKESAAIHAIISAMAAYVITRECARGNIPLLCGCARTRQELSKDQWREILPNDFFQRHNDPDFSWGGCTEDVDFGYKTTKEFLDSSYDAWLSTVPPPEMPFSWPKAIEPAPAYTPSQLTDLHNEEAGRLVVTKSRKIHCRCHGACGACNFQTCWEEMKDWEEVGDDIKKKYDGAVKVKMNHKNTKLINSDAKVKKHIHSDLVFLQDSPNLCTENGELGVEGTQGRKCNGTSDLAEDSCSILCCGRGYKTMTRQEVYPCNIRLRRKPPINIVWDDCIRTATEYFCL
eukprot:m.13224 g.13224  ORF g.13224 m.13224 type:complete len:399 (+) comp24555_c0_seq2:1811-3007(+)